MRRGGALARFARGDALAGAVLALSVLTATLVSSARAHTRRVHRRHHDRSLCWDGCRLVSDNLHSWSFVSANDVDAHENAYVCPSNDLDCHDRDGNAWRWLEGEPRLLARLVQHPRRDPDPRDGLSRRRRSAGHPRRPVAVRVRGDALWADFHRRPVEARWKDRSGERHTMPDPVPPPRSDPYSAAPSS